MSRRMGTSRGHELSRHAALLLVALELDLEHVLRDAPELALLALLLPVDGVPAGVLDLERVHALADDDERVERPAKVGLGQRAELGERAGPDRLGRRAQARERDQERLFRVEDAWVVSRRGDGRSRTEMG